MAFSIGIDIGGSHISGGLVDLDTGQFLSSSYQEININPLAPADEILSLWHNLIQEILSQNTAKSITKIGFAMPGPFDYDKGIALFEGVPKYNKLNGINVKKHLQESLFLANEKNYDIQFINDATAFAIGEFAQGAAQNMQRVWVLTLGTGLGSTFLLNGKPMLSGQGMPDGGYLYNQVFKAGVADEYFSTRWFIKKYKTLSGKDIPNVKNLAELAKNGDKTATDIFFLFAKQLADFLKPWLKNTQSKGVVIGGGIANSWDYFSADLEENLKESGLDIIIKRAVLGGNAPIIGAVAGFVIE